MPTIHIERELADTRCRYVARIDGVAGEAELVFTQRGPDVVSADHTEAPATMRGTGAALALVERLVADARREHFKIIPRCSYVAAQFKRHVEWADVMAA